MILYLPELSSIEAASTNKQHDIVTTASLRSNDDTTVTTGPQSNFFYGAENVRIVSIHY